MKETVSRMRAWLVTIGTLGTLAVCALGSGSVLVAADDWTRVGFTASAAEVYRAAKTVIQQHYELKSVDDERRIIRFHIGTTAWSWGYNVSLTDDPTGKDACEAWVALEKSGGPVFSWGRGKKEVKNIWVWIHDELYKTAKRN